MNIFIKTVHFYIFSPSMKDLKSSVQLWMFFTTLFYFSHLQESTSISRKMFLDAQENKKREKWKKNSRRRSQRSVLGWIFLCSAQHKTSDFVENKKLFSPRANGSSCFASFMERKCFFLWSLPMHRFWKRKKKEEKKSIKTLAPIRVTSHVRRRNSSRSLEKKTKQK